MLMSPLQQKFYRLIRATKLFDTAFYTRNNPDVAATGMDLLEHYIIAGLAAPADALKRTPFHDIHRALGAKLVPFAGYEMPVQYPTGITAEHKAVREGCGVFDVSHMGEFIVRGPTPVGEELEVYHYSRPVRFDARNSVFAVTAQ